MWWRHLHILDNFEGKQWLCPQWSGILWDFHVKMFFFFYIWPLSNQCLCFHLIYTVKDFHWTAVLILESLKWRFLGTLLILFKFINSGASLLKHWHPLSLPDGFLSVLCILLWFITGLSQATTDNQLLILSFMSQFAAVVELKSTFYRDRTDWIHNRLDAIQSYNNSCSLCYELPWSCEEFKTH